MSGLVSPRSANYERLETGMGPTRSGGRKFGWKKFAIGAGVLIGLVWVFGPRRSGLSVEPTYTAPPDFPEAGAEIEPITPTHIAHSPNPPPPAVPEKTKEQVSSPATPHRPKPSSPETDPDPTKTVHCTTPYDTSSPLVQYALMLDAGSTGSRIHIYKFHNCGPSSEYEYEVFKMTKPGLSSYAGRPGEAAASLDVLMDRAMEVVPESLRSCTPVSVKATAGLRLTGAKESKDILDTVRSHLHERYPFPIPAGDEGVSIMDGKDEGVYAWITANYLLGTIRADADPSTLSYAVLDLGGASTQIVFEPKFGKADTTLVEGEHKYDLRFGGKLYVLYQHSYLGYGLMRARAHVHRLVDFMATLRVNQSGSGPVGNPCLARGTKREVEITEDGAVSSRKVTMVGEDIGSFEACNRIVELVMAKDAICETKPCSFDGVYQPSLMDTFQSGKVLLLSYFYDRLDPLLPSHADPGSDNQISVATIASLAQDVCQGAPKWRERWGGDAALMEELADRPEYCLDLTFMHALLRLGYEFQPERQIALGKKIDGTELGWCLGAAIALVGGDLRCRI